MLTPYVLSAVAYAVLASVSLSIDMTGLLDQAFTLFNAFMPLLILISGIILGFALVKWFPNLIKGVFSGFGGK